MPTKTFTGSNGIEESDAFLAELRKRNCEPIGIEFDGWHDPLTVKITYVEPKPAETEGNSPD